ncbi:MAG: ABC transporter permease [Chloroflexi bacterium]|nr:ABC transporter permease [Chloroflexota bacterium]
MNAGRIATLALRIALQFRRDHRTVGLIVVVPMVVLSLLSYLIRLGASELPLGIVQEDRSPIAQRLVEQLRQVEIFEVREVARQELDALLREGRLEAGIVVPEGFARSVVGQGGDRLLVIVEGSRSRTAPMLFQGLNQAMARLAAAQADVRLAEPQVTYLYAGPQYQAIDYFAPTFIALFAFFFVYLLTAVGFLRERAFGTLERLLASPLTKMEMVLGYVTGFSFFALLQSAIILLFTVYVVRIEYAGNLLVVFLIVALLAGGSVNLGIFLSTYARNEFQVYQFLPLVIVPQALLGGVFWPIPEMHPVLQWIAHVLPLTYANFALQEVMIKGEGVLKASVAADIGAMVLFGALMVVLASVGLRRASA